MGHTPEQRTNAARGLCGAKKKNGQRCRAFAGQGTGHLGFGACKFHGGATQSHHQAAVIAEAKKDMVTMGRALDVKPHEALLGLLRATAGHVAWLNAEVGALDSISEPEARQVVSIYGEERDRLARVSKACIDAGLTEADVKLAQETTTQISRAVEQAINSVDGLSRDQRQQFGKTLREELGKLQRQAADESPQPVAA